MKRIAMAAALALSCVSGQALAASAKPVLTTSQLPRTARPVHYALSIVHDAAKLSFEGRAAIQIELLVPSDSITLHAADLAILSASIKAAGGAETPALVTLEIIDALLPNAVRMAAKWELITAAKHFHERRARLD